MAVQLRTCPIHPHDRSMRARSAGMGNCPTNDRPLFIGCFLACNMAVCTKLSQKPPLQTIVRCISCNARLAVRLSLLSSPAKLFVQEFYFVRANEEFAINVNGSWLYFENYQDDGTANDKVVEGSVVPETQDFEPKHMLKATENGKYSFRIEATNKIHITHE